MKEKTPQQKTKILKETLNQLILNTSTEELIYIRNLIDFELKYRQFKK